jgi:hypothetical protein
MIFTFFSDLCALCGFARDIPSFGCGGSPPGEPLFSSIVWEKACIVIVLFIAVCASFTVCPCPAVTGAQDYFRAKTPSDEPECLMASAL